jgi:hypothetical protein
MDKAEKLKSVKEEIWFSKDSYTSAAKPGGAY